MQVGPEVKADADEAEAEQRDHRAVAHRRHAQADRANADRLADRPKEREQRYAGAPRAAAVSIERMRACGLRRNTACSVPGMCRSAT